MIVNFIGATAVEVPTVKVAGPQGEPGWTPVFVPEADGARQVMRITDWTGGQEPKPALGYMGPTGTVADVADAANFAGRGVAKQEAIEGSTDILVTYSDGTSMVVPSYFTPFILAAADVADNLQAIDLATEQVENKRKQVADNTLIVTNALPVLAQNAANALTSEQNAAQSAAGAAAPVLVTPTEVPTVTDMDGAIIVFDGDSKTQNLGTSVTIALASQLRKPGNILAGIKGLINHGSSGYTLKAYVEQPATSLYVVADGDPDPNNFVGAKEGSSTWDYNLKNTTTAVCLADSLKIKATFRVISLGTNDAILYANPGALPLDQFTAYIEGYLLQAIDKIRLVEPNSVIVLMTPTHMTARPLHVSYPNTAAHPTWGLDLAADQALVEKWNTGFDNAYVGASRKRSKTVLYHTGKKVTGKSDTTKLAGTEEPMLGDWVHDSITYGYPEKFRGLALLLNPKLWKTRGRAKKGGRSESVIIGR